MPVLGVFRRWGLGGLLAELLGWVTRGFQLPAPDIWLQNLKSSGDPTVSSVGDREGAVRLAATPMPSAAPAAAAPRVRSSPGPPRRGWTAAAV